jgi:hypothetical protein
VDTIARLNDLVGTKGLLTTDHGEVPFTFLSVNPAPDLPQEADLEAFHNAISLSSFRVQFEEGILIDGSNTMTISGQFISRLF